MLHGQTLATGQKSCVEVGFEFVRARISEVFLGTSDAAARLQISPVRVRQLVEDGRLPAVRVGDNLGFRESDLVDFASKTRQSGRPRIYDLVTEPGKPIAHIANRFGQTFCGLQLTATWAEPHGAGDATNWCSGCEARAPRYVIRNLHHRPRTDVGTP